MNNEIKAVESKINELASKVIPTDFLKSFIELPLSEKVFGIKFFATMSDDKEIIKLCECAEKIIH